MTCVEPTRRVCRLTAVTMVHPFYLSVFRAVRSVTVVRSIGHWCEHCFCINTITLGLGVPSAAPASLVDHKTCTRNSYPKLLCQRAAALVGILNAEEWLAVRAGIAREKCTASPSYIIKHAMASQLLLTQDGYRTTGRAALCMFPRDWQDRSV